MENAGANRGTSVPNGHSRPNATTGRDLQSPAWPFDARPAGKRQLARSRGSVLICQPRRSAPVPGAAAKKIFTVAATETVALRQIGTPPVVQSASPNRGRGLIGTQTMKHVPFDSIYRADYEVVEQREGNTSLYPHTGQLPVLARAMDLEFHGALPPRIARVDARADGFHKILLAHSAMLFCGAVNGSRNENLRLIHLPTPDLVTRVAVVQQLTTTTPRGLCHRSRFYTRDGFLPDIHLSGKRLVFSDHVLQRFSARAPDKIGSDLTTFFLVFYGSPLVAMPVGPGRAFVVQYLT